MIWLNCVAKAVVKYGLKALMDVVPFGSVLQDIAKDAWEAHRKTPNGSSLAADIQAAAVASPAEVKQAVAEAVEANANELPLVEERQALAAYLTQVPAMIRHSLRRPSDPSGTTVPSTLSLNKPQDIVPLLPARGPRFKSGDRPHGHWVLEELLGVGGFGEVWRARHPSDESLCVALKFCLDGKAADSLRNEAKALGRVRKVGRHDGIVKLLNFYEDDPFCLEYEYVEGGDLTGLIREMHQKSSPSLHNVARWMLSLTKTVSFVHSLQPPLVHRDLKPANILVQRGTGNTFRLRIADFGISELAAKQALSEGANNTQITVGVGGYTALYASPQQIAGEPADPRDDVHALGVIWRQMLTGDLNKGRPAGSGWKVPLRLRGMKELMLELLEQCMDDVAEVRPADATDLATRLETIVDGDGGWNPPVNSNGMTFALIPSGAFLMGSPDGLPAEEAYPKHEVEITRPFYIGVYQVTQEKYERVMDWNPTHFSAAGRGKAMVEGMDTTDFPVEKVSWNEAVEFCRRLSELPEEKKAGRSYRLPTEAEWEYACKAGASTLTLFHTGKRLSADQANFNGYLNRTTAVGSYPPNAFGLYDMHGNVWEWCQDWYDEHYWKGSPRQDPPGPEDGTKRITKGGGWLSEEVYCRSANCYDAKPNTHKHHIGFRVVLVLGG